MAGQLIVALDFEQEARALALVDELDPNLCALKVGSEMYTLFGADFVRRLVARRFKVFLDLKFHDIPHTVARACAVSADMGVWMLNVHASGGFVMMEAAVRALDTYGASRPLLIAVTVLTSMADAELPLIGVADAMPQQVTRLAELAQSAGLDGVVSSAFEVPMIKTACGSHFLAITPGIRMPQDNPDDQSRIMTPRQARDAGSDYLVIGRSITRATNPAERVRELLRDA